MKTEIKKLEALIEEGAAKDQVQTQLRTTLKAIDKAAKSNVIHDNTAARKKSSIEKKAQKALA
jgi:small subunit ribosomal protein S20